MASHHTDEALLDEELDDSVYLLDNDKEDELLDDGDHDRSSEQVNYKDDTEHLNYDVASDTMEDDVLDLGISDEDCLGVTMDDSLSESTTKSKSFNQRFTRTIKKTTSRIAVKVAKEDVKNETILPPKSKPTVSKKPSQPVEGKKEVAKEMDIAIENKGSSENQNTIVDVSQDIPCSVTSSQDKPGNLESVEHKETTSNENVVAKSDEEREEENDGMRERFKTERSTKLSLNNLGKQTWEHVPKSLDEVIVDSGASSKSLKGKRPWNAQRCTYDLNIKIAKDQDGSRTVLKGSVEQHSGEANSFKTVPTTQMTQSTPVQEPMYQEQPEVTSVEQWRLMKPGTDLSAIPDISMENTSSLQVPLNPTLHQQHSYSHGIRQPLLIHPPRPTTINPSIRVNIQTIPLSRQVNAFPQPNGSVRLIHPPPRPGFPRTIYQLPPNNYQPSCLPQNQPTVRPLMNPAIQQPQAPFPRFVRPVRPSIFNQNSLHPGLMDQFRQPLVHQTSLPQYPSVEGQHAFYSSLQPPAQTSYNSPLPVITLAPPFQQASAMLPPLCNNNIGEYQEKQPQYNETNGNILLVDPSNTGAQNSSHILMEADKKFDDSDLRSRISQKRSRDDPPDRMWNSKYSRHTSYDREDADRREYRKKIDQRRTRDELLRDKGHERLISLRPQTEEENKQAAEEFLNRINGRRNNTREELKVQVNVRDHVSENSNPFLSKLEAEKRYADKTIKRTINQTTSRGLTRTVTNDAAKSSNSSAMMETQPKQEEIHKLYKVKYKNGDIVYKTMPILTSNELEIAKKELEDKSKLAPKQTIQRRIVVSDNTVTPQTAKVVNKAVINNIDLSESVRKAAGALAASSQKVTLAERFTNIRVMGTTGEDGNNQVKRM